MNRIHIIGRKNAGKTTLVVDLVAELSRRGLRVGTIKHTSHRHDPDVPGKDSWRHRQAGAAPVAILSREVTALFLPSEPEVDEYERLTRFYEGCDLVLVEGGQTAAATKIEVWRAGLGEPPLAPARGDVAAVVSDDAVAVEVPRWPRADVPRLADRVLALASGVRRAGAAIGRSPEGSALVESGLGDGRSRGRGIRDGLCGRALLLRRPPGAKERCTQSDGGTRKAGRGDERVIPFPLRPRGSNTSACERGCLPRRAQPPTCFAACRERGSRRTSCHASFYRTGGTKPAIATRRSCPTSRSGLRASCSCRCPPSATMPRR
jgi:molybdopterin-guanine dinucleotide biosynthesis protein B